MDRDFKKKKAKKSKFNIQTEPNEVTFETSTEMENTHKKKKQKKTSNYHENEVIQDISVTVTPNDENNRQIKKKKRNERHETDNELSKSPDDKPDVVVELKNLSIGDNAYTLTNLLDEMTVVDSEKRKRLKQKSSKNKKSKENNKREDQNADNNQDTEKKWSKRKWNKDTKSVTEDSIDNTIIVQNLPISLIFNYKKLLAEHFVKYGLIKSVGIAEVYLPDKSSGVFTTTVNFYSDGAATQALQEQHTIQGSSVSLRRPLPPVVTSVVARSYGPLTEQALSSLLHTAGTIRNIRHVVKGRNSMATFFIEFDGPEAATRALAVAADAKIGGKKVHLSRFEDRTKNKKQKSTNDAKHTDDKHE